MSTEERFRPDAVNAWLDGTDVVIAGLQANGPWLHWQVSRDDAIELADQLYLLTKESP